MREAADEGNESEPVLIRKRKAGTQKGGKTKKQKKKKSMPEEQEEEEEEEILEFAACIEIKNPKPTTASGREN